MTKNKNWIELTPETALPPIGTKLEIKHFGNWPDDHHIYDDAIVDQWGICPLGDGHSKRSTVTHYRLKEQEKF